MQSGLAHIPTTVSGYHVFFWDLAPYSLKTPLFQSYIISSLGFYLYFSFTTIQANAKIIVNANEISADKTEILRYNMLMERINLLTWANQLQKK